MVKVQKFESHPSLFARTLKPFFDWLARRVDPCVDRDQYEKYLAQRTHLVGKLPFERKETSPLFKEYKVGFFPLGVGRYLSSGVELEEQERVTLDRLLRHLEIKKVEAMSSFEEGISEDQRWLERHQMTIGLARYAMVSDDWRYLNTALKMNDWYFSIYQKGQDETREKHYVCAIKESFASLETLKSGR